MGGAANILEWIVPPIAIAHETIAGAGRAAGLGHDFLAAPGSRYAKQRAGADNTAVRPGMTDAERERDARLAREKRRKEYENLGRSSTILTGPGGLSGSGTGEQKTLLGY